MITFKEEIENLTRRKSSDLKPVVLNIVSGVGD